MNNLKVGDWCVILDECIVPEGEDVSSYAGMVGVVEKIVGNDRVYIDCIMKPFYGKGSLTNVPMCQLVKIDKTDGEMILEKLKQKWNDRR